MHIDSVDKLRSFRVRPGRVQTLPQANSVASS